MLRRTLSRPKGDISSSPFTGRARLGWFPSLVAGSLSVLVGLLVSGVVLAMAGIHVAWLQAPLTAVLATLVFRALPTSNLGDTITKPQAIALIVLITTVISFNYALRSELIFASRDGATYANTASSLIAEGGLLPLAVEEPFVDDRLNYEAFGFVLRDDGRLWQQFLHATPAMYAFFGELFGPFAIFGVNAFIAGIAVLTLFALALRFVGGWWALLAAGLTASSLPFLYYSRNTFSEMTALALSAGALWAAHLALTSHPGAGFGAGVLIGTGTIVRIDGWMMIVALGGLAITTTWLGENAERRTTERMFAGAGVVAVLGLMDLVLFSQPYVVILGRNVLVLLVLAVGLRLIAPAFANKNMQSLLDRLKERPAIVLNVATFLLAAGAIYLWFVRPFLPAPRSAGAVDLSILQEADGLPIDPTRSYQQLAPWWLVWYLGIPITAAAIVGVIATARRAVQSGHAAVRFVLLAVVVPAATYLTRPSVTPDHIWAVRRFLPVVIPAAIIVSVVLTSRIIERLRPRLRAAAYAIASLGALPLLVTSWALAGDADRPGVAAQFEAMCASFGVAQSVLVIDTDPVSPLSWQVGPPLRSRCGLTVAGITPEEASLFEADVIMATIPDALPAGDLQSHSITTTAWNRRLSGPPNAIEPRSITLWTVLSAPG